MSPLFVTVLMVAAWVCVIAWLVRGRSRIWIKGVVVTILVGLTAAWLVPKIEQAEQYAKLVEAEKHAQEKQINAMLRESRSRR